MPAPSTQPAIVLNRPSMARRPFHRALTGVLYAGGVPWASHGVGAKTGRFLPPLSSLSTGGFRLDRWGFRDSKRVWPRRSSGNGGKPSQPRPKRSQILSHQAGTGEAKGRAADEAAARRKLRACPLADAKAACFVKRPKGFQPAFGQAGNLEARHRTFGSRTRPAESGTSVRAPPPVDLRASARDSPGQDRASARELRKRRTQGFGSWTPGGTGASASDPAGRGTEGFGRRNRQGGNRDASSNPPDRKSTRLN